MTRYREHQYIYVVLRDNKITNVATSEERVYSAMEPDTPYQVQTWDVNKQLIQTSEYRRRESMLNTRKKFPQKPQEGTGRAK